MYDAFTFERGRILFGETDIYDKSFSLTRSKTAEHNIYERAAKDYTAENEKTQKSKKTEEN